MFNEKKKEKGSKLLLNKESVDELSIEQAQKLVGGRQEGQLDKQLGVVCSTSWWPDDDDSETIVF